MIPTVAENSGNSASPRRSLSASDRSKEYSLALDRADQLAGLRHEFCIPSIGSINADPLSARTNECVYLTGNSLGLQPRSARGLIERELTDWANLAVESHIYGRDPWLRYHESLRGPLARLIGCGEQEVVAMNTLTVNLHLMMLTFYRPAAIRNVILIEDNAFPSDSYAAASQASLHGLSTRQVVRLKPRDNEVTLKTADIIDTIDRLGSSLAVVMLGGVNYLSGEVLDMPAITQAAQAQGAICGWDLAHAVGNIPLRLHDWNADFAVWCSYKYLNSGPGAVGGAYVHERHCRDTQLIHPAGWWGNEVAQRFEMKPDFVPVLTADRWALSNPPVFSLAPVKASLEIFDRVGIDVLRRKSLALTGYLESLLEAIVPEVRVLTPADPAARGCQLSLRLPRTDGRTLLNTLKAKGVICDFRAPDIIRAAPVPLYNSFQDVWSFVHILRDELRNGG